MSKFIIEERRPNFVEFPPGVPKGYLVDSFQQALDQSAYFRLWMEKPGFRGFYWLDYGDEFKYLIAYFSYQPIHQQSANQWWKVVDSIVWMGKIRGESMEELGVSLLPPELHEVTHGFTPQRITSAEAEEYYRLHPTEKRLTINDLLWAPQNQPVSGVCASLPPG